MNYPKNRLIVNGVDLTERFKMILTDDYTFTPPSIKTYKVDIPGGHGQLDLTEALFGDVVYDNRKEEYTFNLIDVDNFERAKTEISKFLHGRYYEYKKTMDPEYTYKGRFSVSSYSRKAYASGILGIIKISIDGDPFKYKKEQVYTISCVGGSIFYFNSGSKRVLPTIETYGLLKVIFNKKVYILPQGSWILNDVYFDSGINEVYFNSFDIHNLTWGDIKNNGTTWGEFKKKKLYEWYKSNGAGTLVFTTWDTVSANTWEYYAEQSYADISYMYEKIKDVKDSYIKYEWGDL